MLCGGQSSSLAPGTSAAGYARKVGYILEAARTQERIVITRDKDFGTLAVRDRLLHCGILRVVELPPSLNDHAEDLARGCLLTVESHCIRIREPASS